MPAHHDVRPQDIVVRRLHGSLAAAADRGPADFAELLLVPGVGAADSAGAGAWSPRSCTARPAASPTRRASRSPMAARTGIPFPVPLKVYDQTIGVLKARGQEGEARPDGRTRGDPAPRRSGAAARSGRRPGLRQRRSSPRSGRGRTTMAARASSAPSRRRGWTHGGRRSAGGSGASPLPQSRVRPGGRAFLLPLAGERWPEGPDEGYVAKL